ncbi:hypothetical protein LSH36_68g01031 [Paralvinella palmiformis]|uniref:Uncharacterized protein n=1 Tax=Paralvinella palmiformis TaxID=53620 RepID=A0AAD9K390_9ANNE|nr:hypothetical protein LSH36_68g01031 [Paralvinella palmiformis]
MFGLGSQPTSDWSSPRHSCEIGCKPRPRLVPAEYEMRRFAVCYNPLPNSSPSFVQSLRITGSDTGRCAGSNAFGLSSSRLAVYEPELKVASLRLRHSQCSVWVEANLDYHRSSWTLFMPNTRFGIAQQLLAFASDGTPE